MKATETATSGPLGSADLADTAYRAQDRQCVGEGRKEQRQRDCKQRSRVKVFNSLGENWLLAG
jgi:hypothetical protein